MLHSVFLSQCVCAGGGWGVGGGGGGTNSLRSFPRDVEGLHGVLLSSQCKHSWQISNDHNRPI